MKAAVPMISGIGLVWIMATAFSLFCWWGGISIGTSLFKKVSDDCGKHYQADKYLATNLFCPTNTKEKGQ